MAAVGMTLTSIRVIGGPRPPAEVEFRPGFNVVAGASNTGKSYILQLINHMMGGSKPPKALVEANGYERVQLGLSDRAGSQYVLERSLFGADFKLFEGAMSEWREDAPSRLLKAKHNPKSDETVSSLLLKLSGLGRATVLMNKAGRTRPMSFRDLARFILIDEVRIIDERSPVFPSGQVVKRTEDRSVFEIVISGKDAKGTILIPDVGIRRADWRARLAVYDDLIESLRSQLHGVEVENSLGTQAVDARIDALTEQLSASTERLSDLLLRRTHASDRLRRIRARVMQIEGLLERFALLRLHYESDIERLVFLGEGDSYISQLGEGYCPLCGSLLSGHTAEDLRADEERRVSIQQASRAEIFKLRSLLDDLDQTVSAMTGERGDLAQQDNAWVFELRQIETEINDEVEPEVRATKAELSEATNERIEFSVAEQTRLRLRDLLARREALGTEPKRVPSTSSSVQNASTPARRAFCDTIQRLLRAWNVESNPTVEFDETMDLVVSGKARQSHGKGFRAILHAAFTVGMMQYCKAEGLSHPGIVVLDSPLTSYKPGDDYEVGQDIQLAFWQYLIALPRDEQVVVLENKEPPKAIRAGLHYTHFSGNPSSGRSGFYPPYEARPSTLERVGKRSRPSGRGKKQMQPGKPAYA